MQVLQSCCVGRSDFRGMNQDLCRYCGQVVLCLGLVEDDHLCRYCSHTVLCLHSRKEEQDCDQHVQPFSHKVIHFTRNVATV